MFDVAVIGSANLDLVATTERLPAPGETVLGRHYAEFAGGKGLNQAVAAARVGARVAFVGAVGDDEAGTRLLELAASEGIDVSGLGVVAGVPTGRAVITVDDAARNCIVVVAGANATVTVDVVPSATVLLAQLEIPPATVLRAFTIARAAGAVTILNPAPAAPLADELLEVTDVLVPNEHEVEMLGGADSLVARGVGVLVVTRGAAGVTVHERGARWSAPALRVRAVDTTGAGDAFCGVLAARLAAGDPLTGAVRWASAAGALATTVAGAVPSLPSFAQVSAALSVDPA